ncbi:hypothetical protein KIW84_062729 [Lathyrus oleraceus]|uniref:HECT domain-containing protein n=1 Tax=Pisum sativum TaxID=3888 RepID=A0A9D4W9K7_PEA|nr:hypothetical protein KIW84_062729 [Pisum sativum]
MEWLFSHPEEVPEDDELARALAMSLGTESDTKDEVPNSNAHTTAQQLEEKIVQFPSIDELLSTYTKPSRYGAAEVLVGLNVDNNAIIDEAKANAVIGHSQQRFLVRTGAIEMGETTSHSEYSDDQPRHTLLRWIDGFARLVLKDKLAILRAAESIASVCINEHMRIAFKKAGALNQLIWLLSSNDDAIQLTTTQALEALSASNMVFRFIEAKGGVDPLVTSIPKTVPVQIYGQLLPGRSFPSCVAVRQDDWFECKKAVDFINTPVKNHRIQIQVKTEPLVKHFVGLLWSSIDELSEMTMPILLSPFGASSILNECPAVGADINSLDEQPPVQTDNGNMEDQLATDYKHMTAAATPTQETKFSFQILFSLNGSASNLPDGVGRSFTTSFSSQWCSLTNLSAHWCIQGLHNMHGSFNIPNVPSTLTSRNSSLNSMPSGAVQQPTSSLSSGRFSSNNLPAALSPLSHGISHGHSGVNRSLDSLDVDDLRQHTNYVGSYHSEHDVIEMFWEVLKGFSMENQEKFLKFVTGCSRGPLLGFRYLEPLFCIQRAGGNASEDALERLPTSTTCMNLLKLLPYRS